MKIKIVEPYDYDPRYDQRSLTANTGPVSVATFLTLAGHAVEVLSEYVCDFEIGEPNEADLVGISITTFNACKGFEIAGQVEKPVVFGGFHATLMPEECMQYGDYVIRGDGFSIADLAEAVDGSAEKRLSDVPNLVYRENGRVIRSRREARTVDVVPDFGLVRGYYKFGLGRLLRIPLLVNGSRGCVFDCTFCSIKAAFPDFKKKRIETIIADIESQVGKLHFLSRFLPRIIWITDDNFTSDMNWAKALLKEIAKLETGCRFTIQVRVDAAHDEELLQLMQKAGIGRVYIGIESLCQEALSDFDKKTAAADIETAVSKFRAHGIDVHGLFIFGDDGFEEGDGLKVAEFVRHNKMSGLLIQPLTPFPATPLFDKFEKQNRLLHKDWRRYGDKVVIRPANMAPAELQKEVYDCYRAVFSPLRVLRFMLAGKRGFRLEFLGEALLRHLEWRKIRRYIRNELGDEALRFNAPANRSAFDPEPCSKTAGFSAGEN